MLKSGAKRIPVQKDKENEPRTPSSPGCRSGAIRERVVHVESPDMSKKAGNVPHFMTPNTSSSMRQISQLSITATKSSPACESMPKKKRKNEASPQAKSNVPIRKQGAAKNTGT